MGAMRFVKGLQIFSIDTNGDIDCPLIFHAFYAHG